MTYIDPPPNNAGMRNPHFDFNHYSQDLAQVANLHKKTVEYEDLTVTYDYADKELTVLNKHSTEEIAFDEKELIEFRAALVALGVPYGAPGEGITYR